LVDAVLLDAPCSATGIYRRHPDVIHRVQPRAIRELAEVQKAMLARAAGWLKPGGRLVYSVCSLEPEEGEEVVRTLAEGRTDLAQDETKRILPGDWKDAGGADSFFMARFQRD
jgi:16S rRNA (cytosine967-C5)-methyltransferase